MLGAPLTQGVHVRAKNQGLSHAKVYAISLEPLPVS